MNIDMEEVIALIEKQGVSQTAAQLGMGQSTLYRYWRRYRDDVEPAKKLAASLSPRELRLLQRSLSGEEDRSITRVEGVREVLRFAVVSDTHWGSKSADTEFWRWALERIERAGSEYLFHLGDLSEGLSPRKGHVFDLAIVGYKNQLRYVVDRLAEVPENLPTYIISGNHDRWYLKHIGADIVAEACESFAHIHNLGHDHAEVELHGVKVRLWHGEDGSSYAVSYRIQKIVELLSASDTPDVLLCGHVHKSLYAKLQGIHAISAGALSRPSKWMTSTRKSQDAGFWTVEIDLIEGRIDAMRPTWHELGVHLIDDIVRVVI